MKKHILTQVWAVCLSCALWACSQEQPNPSSSNDAESRIQFSLDLNLDPIQDATTGAKALLYDADNLAQGKYPRFSSNNAFLTHTFIFDGKTLVGYTLLDWKAKRGESGQIALSCRKELPVYEMTERFGATTLNKNKTITLSAGKTYKFLGIMGDGLLELDMPNEIYQARQTYGPRISFDPKDYAQIFANGKLRDGEGCIPYVFHRDIKIEETNKVKVLSTANPQMRVTPATPVLRFIVKNETERPINSEDIKLSIQGITPKFVLGAMSGYQSPGHRIYRGIPQHEENDYKKKSYSLPIADLAPGATGTYYIPIVMTNGDPANVESIRLLVEPGIGNDGTYSYRVTNTLAPNKFAVFYIESDKEQMKRYWMNIEGRYNMHTISVKVTQQPWTPEE